jgi:hypothetical protein
MPRRTGETKGRIGEPTACRSTHHLSHHLRRDARIDALRAYELYARLPARQVRLADGRSEVLRCLWTNPLDEPPRVARSVNGGKKAAPKPVAPSRSRTTSRKNKPRSEAA